MCQHDQTRIGVGPSSVLSSPSDRGRLETHAHRAPVPADPSRAAAAGSATRLAAVAHSAALGGRHAAWVGPSSVLPSPPDRGRRETHAHRKPVPAHPSRAAAAGSATGRSLAAVTHSAAMGGRHAAWVGPSSVLPSPPDRGRRETHAHRAPVPAHPSPAAAAGCTARLAAVTESAAMGGRHAAWVGASSVLPSPPDRGRRETHAHRAPVPERSELSSSQSAGWRQLTLNFGGTGGEGREGGESRGEGEGASKGQARRKTQPELSMERRTTAPPGTDRSDGQGPPSGLV